MGKNGPQNRIQHSKTLRTWYIAFNLHHFLAISFDFSIWRLFPLFFLKFMTCRIFTLMVRDKVFEMPYFGSSGWDRVGERKISTLLLTPRKCFRHELFSALWHRDYGIQKIQRILKYNAVEKMCFTTPFGLDFAYAPQ